MMKKIIAALAALALIASTAIVLADTPVSEDEWISEETHELAGVIEEVLADGFTLTDGKDERFEIHTDDATEYEGLAGAQELAAGQYVYVRYDGKMTRSIPAQVTAQQVFCYRVSGVVADAEADGFLLEEQDEQGERMDELFVHLGDCTLPEIGARVTVYYNGVMAMSLPGQITASEISVHD